MTTHKVTVSTTGSAGVAAGSGTTERPVRGFLTSIRLDYHASAPATTDVTIAETGAQARNLLVRSNSGADGTFYPSVQMHDNAAAAVTAYQSPYIDGEYITVTLAQCDQLTSAIVVYIQVAEA